MKPQLLWYLNHIKTQQKQNYRLVSLVNTDVRIHSIIPSKWIEECIKKIIHYYQVGREAELVQYLKANKFNSHIYRLKDKNHVVVVLDAESAFDKNPKPLPDKSSEEIRNRRDIPKHDKGNLLYYFITANINLKGKKLKGGIL